MLETAYSVTEGQIIILCVTCRRHYAKRIYNAITEMSEITYVCED